MIKETCDIDIKQAWNNQKLQIRWTRINVPPADMLVADSKPLTFLTLRQNNLQRVGYSQKLVSTIRIVLASDTCGLIKENFYYLHAYLAGGVFKAICVKPTLSYPLNHFLFHQIMRQSWHENQCLFYPCSPIKILIKKLE